MEIQRPGGVGVRACTEHETESWGNPESAWGTGLGKRFELEKSMSESGSTRGRVGRAKEKAADHPSSSRRLAEPEGGLLKVQEQALWATFSQALVSIPSWWTFHVPNTNLDTAVRKTGTESPQDPWSSWSREVMSASQTPLGIRQVGDIFS